MTMQYLIRLEGIARELYPLQLPILANMVLMNNNYLVPTQFIHMAHLSVACDGIDVYAAHLGNSWSKPMSAREPAPVGSTQVALRVRTLADHIYDH